MKSPQLLISTGASTEETQQRQYVEELASRKIQGFVGTIDAHGEYLDPVYQSNRSLSESIGSDYKDRYLIELIQNAYDAHPVGTHDGKVHITLDRRCGKFGTLFVANSGHPFDENNVRGLCDIGLSQKPLGASIGNKGLGFRSVIQITNSPRIYSQCPDTLSRDRFSGFCFRFAVPKDYSNLIDNPKHRELACCDLPNFHLPIFIDKQSNVVRSYAKAGFSTVIELPLRDEDSQESVQHEIGRLQNQRDPVLLFLNRVASLIVRTIDRSGQSETELEFTRLEENFEANEQKLSRVYLDHVGQFLVARQSIAEATMKSAIQMGISNGELNEYWEKWTGDGEVAVAVRLDSDVESPRLYTFLPMGKQATAPFSGYLHGSFSPSSNRESLDARIRLNTVLLTKAAILAAETIHHIITDTAGRISNRLTTDERVAAVVDLLCWVEVDSLDGSGKFATDLTKWLCDHFYVSCFEEVPVVPCLSLVTGKRKLIWQPPAQARRWPNDTDVFTAVAAAEFAKDMSVWPIWDALGHRIDALDGFLSAHADGYEGVPSAEERGQLVNLVAKKLGETRRTPKNKWRNFYNDLPEFIGRDGKCLAGMPVLLCDDNQLHKAMSTESSGGGSSRSSRRRRRSTSAAVFSPPDPRRTSSEDYLEVSPPKRLSNRFAFLNSEYSWHEDLGDVRKYLEEHKLVGEFDRETVLSNLSRILEDENNKEVLRGGLRWAFQLWRQPRNGGRPFRLQPQHRFRVPTLNGEYVKASEAVFSTDWPEEVAGKILQEFLDVAPTGLPDLERLKDLLLAKPDHPAFLGKFIDDWVQFLKELGVNSGLTPELKSGKNHTFRAYRLSNFEFAKDYGIPLDFIDIWREDIVALDSSLLNLPYTTNYEIVGELSWMPGQADFGRFSVECKERYAELILLWLTKNTKALWSIKVRHTFYYQSDSRVWPTPLQSFLRSAGWLPVIDPAFESVGLRPSDVWVNDSSHDRLIHYLRRPSNRIQRYFNHASDEFIECLKNRCGIRIFNDPSGLPDQLEFLSQQYSSDGFNRYFEPHLINLYNQAWQLLANSPDDDRHNFDPSARPSNILIQRRDAYELMSMLDNDDGQGEPVYVCDTNRESDMNLLEASGQPFLFVPNTDGQKVGALLEAMFGQRIRRLSQITSELLADGKDIEDCGAVPALEVCPRLRTMVAVAMEALSGTEAQRLPSDRGAILARLERLKMIKVKSLSFIFDEINVPIGKDKFGAFHFRLDDDESIIAVQSYSDWTWELVDLSIRAICEALGGHTALTSYLRLLVSRIDEGESPNAVAQHSEDVERFSNILQLSPSEMQKARVSLSAGVERCEPWIRAVLHLSVGSAAVEAFDSESEDVLKDVGLLQDALSRLLEGSPVSAEKVVEICRTALGAGDFRKKLELDFGDFNASLVALGLEHERYPDLHASRLENFIREKQNEINECFRAAHAGQLGNMQPVESYSTKRDSVLTLQPDPAWLTICIEPPEDLLVERVNAWLAEQSAPSLGCQGDGLESLDQVRNCNQRFVHDFAKRAIPLVRAWCVKRKQLDSLTALMTHEDGSEQLRRRLDDVGVLDYRTLSETALMNWLQVLELWPIEMDLSLELEVLGLSKEDLAAESTKELQRKEAQERENRSIQFNCRPVDPIDADLIALSEELHNGLPQSVLSKKLRPEPRLDVTGGQTGSPGSGKNGSSHSSVSRMPAEKAELIGQLGECAVYHWLRKILPKQDINAAWQSTNGTQITGRNGDDGLGYDFIVSYQKQKWQIEVKASLSDPQSFSMGETEVRAARDAARSRSGVQYRIAYVSNLSDTNATDIEMLPNPMTEEGGRVFQLRGQGIRYGFNRN